MPKAATYEPMTFANMRQHGMTRLDVSCHAPDCWHRANVDVSRYAEDVIVAELCCSVRQLGRVLIDPVQ